jgi:hypothetical protein
MSETVEELQKIEVDRVHRRGAVSSAPDLMLVLGEKPSKSIRSAEGSVQNVAACAKGNVQEWTRRNQKIRPPFRNNAEGTQGLGGLWLWDLYAAARSSLYAPRATTLGASSGNGRCSAFASSHVARIQTGIGLDFVPRHP